MIYSFLLFIRYNLLYFLFSPAIFFIWNPIGNTFANAQKVWTKMVHSSVNMDEKDEIMMHKRLQRSCKHEPILLQ